MLDQLTRTKRANFFKLRSFEQHITEQQKKNHMNSLKIINGVPRGLHLISRFNLPENEVALRKALFISRRSARLADAAVDANIGVGNFERLNPEEKADLWSQFYERAMGKISLRREVVEDPALGRQIVFLQRFFSLPLRIYDARERHWGIIQKVTKRLTENQIDPKDNFLQELDRLTKKARDGRKEIRKIAMDICVASSIYADMKAREGVRWSDAYQDGMELAYPKIKDVCGLVEAIADL